MKEQFDSDALAELVHYRMQRADETLAEAECLADNRHYSGAVNRLYYACYYAVTALLLDNDIQATTHAGVRTMFALKFIKPGIINMTHGKFFNEIFEQRHSSDYDDLVFCDKETYQHFKPQADSLLTAIRTYLYPTS